MSYEAKKMINRPFCILQVEGSTNHGHLESKSQVLVIGL